MGLGSLLSAGVGLLGGILDDGDDAAMHAAQLQADASQRGIDESRRQFNISREIMQPYVQAGLFGLYGLPPGGLTAEQAYGGSFGAGATGSVPTAAQRLGIDPSTLPDAVPYAQLPAGERPTNFGGRGGMNAARRIQAYDNQVKAFEDYQNYMTELGRMGLTPQMADAIRQDEEAKYRAEVEGTDFVPGDSLTLPEVQREKAGIPAAAGEGEAFQPGGLFGYAQAGQDALPILQSFAQTGSDALAGQRDLIGLGGADAQRAAIEGLRGTPEYELLVREGEEALLQNAAATGGVRGGRTTDALMEYRPQVLTDLINRQYSRLGGLAGQGGTIASQLGSQGQSAFSNIAGLGQASAAGQASRALSTGANIANLSANQGAALAGGTLGAANARANRYSNIAEGLGGLIGDRSLEDVGRNVGRVFGAIF